DAGGLAWLRRPVAAEVAGAGGVEPAVVEEDGGSRLPFEHGAGAVPDAVALRRGERLHGPLAAGGPLDDVGRAVVGEGQADEAPGGGALGGDLDLDALGRAAAGQAPVGLAGVHQLQPLRRGPGRRRRFAGVLTRYRRAPGDEPGEQGKAGN